MHSLPLRSLGAYSTVLIRLQWPPHVTAWLYRNSTRDERRVVAEIFRHFQLAATH